MHPTIRRMRITVEGKSYDVSVEMLGDSPVVLPSAVLAPVAPVVSPTPVASPAAPAPVEAPPAPRPVASKAAGSVASPLAGTVMVVHVREGQAVKEGETLVTLEAMKMNTAVRAPAAGTVKSVAVAKGQSVEEGTVLLVLG